MIRSLSEVSIREINLSQTLGLREAVLSVGHEGRPTLWKYDEDPRFVHYGALDPKGNVVGCVSLGPFELPVDPDADQYRFHSMAVAAVSQNKGIGGALLRHVVKRAKDLDAKTLWATARESAVSFYTEHGLTVVEGADFIVPETGFRCQYVVLNCR